MANGTIKRDRGAGAKAIAAVTLAVALLLTGVFMYYGFAGRDMDREGLYKLLPWLPIPGESTRWRQALVPGADLGETVRTTLALTPEGNASVTDAQLKEALNVLTRRMVDAGWTGAQVQVSDGKLLAATPASEDETHALTILSAKGDVSFATPAGEVFLSGDHIVNAWFGPSQEQDVYAVSFQLDNEGKKLFGEKTQELIGQSISILLDGQTIASPGISEALVDGFASIPAFTQDEAKNLAVLMRSGPLPLPITEEAHDHGAPLFGEGSQDRLVIALAIATVLILAYFVIRFRVGGLIAVWMLGLQLALSYFFAALMGAGYTLSTLLPVYASFLLAAFSALMILSGMSDDLSRGRSVLQALRASYSNAGHVSLDVLGGLLALSVILIILDMQQIGMFMRIMGVGLLIDLIMMHIVLRALMSSTITLLGENTALYHHRGAVREAV